MRRRCVLIVFYLIMILAVKGGARAMSCSGVLKHCRTDNNVPGCVERNMRTCVRGKIIVPDPNLYLMNANSSSETRVNTVYGHVIHIPIEAVLKSGGNQSDTKDSVKLTVSVLNHSLFEAPSGILSTHEQVLGVWLGDKDVHNLSEPVKIMFSNITQNGSGECVFWKLDKGSWSKDGCRTIQNNTDIVCNCNHLSFFAVLISPEVPSPAHVQNLVYISYVGSSLSVVFSAIVIVFLICQRKSKAEHSISIRFQLTVSLFLLHLFFLVSSFSSEAASAVCKSLGLIMHWALLATFTWTAIEGFHLYLLLVRVFNIYIRKYLLKLSLVGWGVPTIAVIICGGAGAYGKYVLSMKDIINTTVNTDLCWFTTENQTSFYKALMYTTVNGYLGLVLLFNTVIMVVIVVKMRQLRARNIQVRDREKSMWKDLATLLVISCILGLPWGLAFTTHGALSLPGTYLFSILNGFQGVFIFLWFLSITCKSIREKEQSTKDTSMGHLTSKQWNSANY
ncbi:adhesion G protein-coupled receptor G3 [Hoplias malabaricus]|uniref:adhesion G protein-coupled receptor G3 n=1 Tax=Hoplias malabaricus TaxID=27720 RepID=UPI00346217D2